MFKKIIIFCCFSIQLFSQNQHQPQEWETINTEYVNVIFKKEQKQEAEQIINTITYIQKNNQTSIGNHTHPIDIILRGNTVNSNGFVTLSPFRSEFFNTSPQTFNNLGTTDWLSVLAIHEYRHVQQFLNHKKGASKILYYLFGESGWGLGSVMAIPNWYFEGDAVNIETALTNSGRGRLPKFSSLQRAILADHTKYSYQKLRNQSYKNLLPNHYRTGYQILNYYRNHYNGSTLNTITSKAAAYKFPFYPFSYQLKKQTGFNTKELYLKTLDDNQKRWQNQRNILKVENYKQVNSTQNKVQLYGFPQILNNNKIIALKTSFDELPCFYSIDKNGKEEKISNNIINIDNYFEHKNQQLIYTGISYHPRYNYTEFNDIYVYDMDSKTQKQISSKKRYFSPSFNQNNTKIITVEKQNNKSSIVVLNAANGDILKSIPLQGHIARPKFIDDHHFVFLQQNNHRLAIFKMNIDGTKTQLTPYTHHSIDNIQVHQKHIYYSSSFTGIDNLFRSPLNGNKTIEQITNANIGAYQPFVKNDQIYFTETTSNGNKISSTTIQPQLYNYKNNNVVDWNISKTLTLEKGNILNKIDSTTYKSKPYKGVLKGLKIHDWQYYATNAIATANLTASNLLNDVSLWINSSYYLNENNSFGIGLFGSYKKWFPELNLGLQHTYRNFDFSFSDIEENLQIGQLSYNQTAITPSISIPLSQIKGNYTRNLDFNIGYELTHVSEASFYNSETKNSTIYNNIEPFYQAYNSSLTVSNTKRTATQHINPHGGFSSSFSFSDAVNGDLNGNVFYTSHLIYLPGIKKNHNSYISLAYRKNNVTQNNSYYNLNPDTFTYARGYTVSETNEAIKSSFNYQLPLFYPDFGIWGITYFKRIRANLFADISYVSQIEQDLKSESKAQNSIGFEIVFDNTFFNINQAEIGIGYRGSFLLNNDLVNQKQSYINGLFLSTSLF